MARHNYLLRLASKRKIISMSNLKNNREHDAHYVASPVMGQGLMLSSFDYALGRATYMPSVIASILGTTAAWLSKPQRDYVASTIRERVDKHTAGWECDERTWLDLADAVDGMSDEPEEGRRWTPGNGDYVLFPAFGNRLGIDDWWCMVGSAQRYDLRGDGRLTVGDYHKLVELNVPHLNEKWRLNLMLDVENSWKDSKFWKTAYTDDSKAADEYYVWLAGLEINGSKPKREYLDGEYYDEAIESVRGGDEESGHASTEEE